MDDKNLNRQPLTQKNPQGKNTRALPDARRVTFNHKVLAQQIQVESQIISRLPCSQRTRGLEEDGSGTYLYRLTVR